MKKLSEKDFNHIYSKVPRLCVDLLIKTDKGILLTKRKINPDNGKWHFPGGTVFFKETLEKAVKRVAKQELNVNVKIIKDVGYMNFLGRDTYPVSIAFLVEIVSGEIKLDFQASEYKFFEELPKNIVEEHKEFLEKYWREFYK